MVSLERPSNISFEAWKIMKAVYKNYDENDSKEFDNFSAFNYPNDDLIKYCKELDTNKYVFLEHDPDGQMYLFMLPKILGCTQD